MSILMITGQDVYIKEKCPACQGSGNVVDGDTVITIRQPGRHLEIKGICNACWGSGDITHPGVDWFLKDLSRKIDS